MFVDKKLKGSVLQSFVCVALLSVLFILFNWNKSLHTDVLTALPYFIVLYFLMFSIGKPEISDWLRQKMGGDIRKIILLPALLVVLYYSYVIINGQNPLKGELFLVPYLLFFPVIVFAARKEDKQKLDWLDFLTFFLYFFPVTLISVKPDGDLPFNGGDFDSIYRIAVMLAAVFAFTTIRNIRDVGFYPVFKARYFFTVAWVWAAFYLFVLAIGYSVNFIKPVGHDTITLELIDKIGKALVAGFLHTALFEELVFRGLLQNMLSKRIEQARSWKVFWIWGLIILILLALLAGYSLKGGMQWFPALVTLLLFIAAYAIEKTATTKTGAYTALAITSVIFGIVHFHAGSIVFVGLASIGGWAYGYTYLKTKNVFYAALLHALVNATPLIFGLDLAK